MSCLLGKRREWTTFSLQKAFQRNLCLIWVLRKGVIARGNGLSKSLESRKRVHAFRGLQRVCLAGALGK